MQTPHLPQSPAGWRRRVLVLALPIILSNASVPLVGIVDTAVMGHMDSPVYLSATAIGAILFSSIYWVFGFLRMGTSGLVAQALGAGNRELARRTTARALMIAILIALFLIATGSMLFQAGLWLMAVSAEVHSLARSYFDIRLMSAPATLMLYVIIGSLVGLQRMREVFVLQLLLNLSNVALTLLFFMHTDWHIKGVALATVISEYLSLFAGLYMLRNELFAFGSTNRSRKLPAWLWEQQTLADFFRIGGNLFIRTLCLTAAFYWLTVVGSRLGVTVLAANAVLVQMLHLMSHGLDGFAHAAETLAGYAYGARDRKSLSSAVTAATFWAVLLSLAMSAVYFFTGSWIIDQITSQAEVQQAARQWLPWIVFSPLIGVWSFLLDGIFTGTTHTREMRNGMLISLPVFVLATIVLVPWLDNHGLWLAYYCLMIARAATLAVWYPRVVRATM